MTQHKNSGFTIIELIITISIMAILTTLVVVSLRTSQDNAKAKERKDDVDAIARTLENIYSNGIQSSGAPSNLREPLGYPSTNLISAPSSTESSLIFGEIEQSSLKSPNDSSPTATVQSLQAAANNSTSQTLSDKYIYQPLTSTGALCTGTPTIQPRATSPCVKFNLFYKSSDGLTMVAKESVNR